MSRFLCFLLLLTLVLGCGQDRKPAPNTRNSPGQEKLPPEVTGDPASALKQQNQKR